MSNRQPLIFNITLCITLLFLLLPKSYAQSTSQEAVMLVLGSDNPESLQHRVNIAIRLYNNSELEFERIVVSGGCAAHGSPICEASEMDSLLVLNGVPENKIFKEEKSKTTKQNFCYSKRLSQNGAPLISETTSLYVVSDHWHAIPVAACFQEAENVANSTYHIEGGRNPRGPADYTNIFKECRTENYCRSVLWPYIDAAYFNELTNKIHYFVEDIYYRATPGEGIDAGYPKKIDQYTAWPKDWTKNIDAAYFNPEDNKVYLFKDIQFISHAPGKGIDPDYPKKISRHFKNWPDSWGSGDINAAYYDSKLNKLYLFKGSGYIRYTDQEMESGYPANIKNNFSADWPFQWGSGDLDAAYFNSKASQIFLSRGNDFLQYSSDKKLDSEYPKTISLPWPKQLWGKRPEQ
jgi:hypothetical protein